MTPEAIAACFTDAKGQYLCARWARPLVPVIFGLEEQSLVLFKDAIAALARLAGRDLAETDPELGANLMIFFCRDWQDLAGVPNLDRLVAGLDGVLARLQAAGADQYRMLRFDPAGAIRAGFVFLRMGGDLGQRPADEIALIQAVRVMLSWSDSAFAQASPLALAKGHAVLRPEIAALIRAAYDPALPDVARDASHALRLAARMGAQLSVASEANPGANPGADPGARP